MTHLTRDKARQKAILITLKEESGQSYLLGHWLHVFNQNLPNNHKFENTKALSHFMPKLKECGIKCEKDLLYIPKDMREVRRLHFFRLQIEVKA